MNGTDYYFVYRCLEMLVKRKKITRRVANIILKEYEEKYSPTIRHQF